LERAGGSRKPRTPAAARAADVRGPRWLGLRTSRARRGARGIRHRPCTHDLCALYERGAPPRRRFAPPVTPAWTGVTTCSPGSFSVSEVQALGCSPRPRHRGRLTAVPTAIRFLYWCDVDPSKRSFDPAAARAIAETHVLWAVGGNRALRGPLGGRTRDAVESSIDREIIGAYGAWAAGWRWAASEPGGGGPVRGWCCAADSLFRKGDADAMASVDRVVAAVTEWRAFLVELAERFEALRAATAGLALEQAVEHAAARLLPVVVERTSAEDAWYATFEQVLSWYLEFRGLDPAPAREAVGRVISGRFASWCAPGEELASATCSELAAEVACIVDGHRDDGVAIDGLGAWLAIRDRVFANPPTTGRTLPVRHDGHRTSIEGAERERDPQRAQRMLSALDACRESARRGETLTFDRLAPWQAIVLGEATVGFRTTDAYAKGGRERYPFAVDTRARFDAALDDANGKSGSAAVRAARVYLDVCFFHPFRDGNGRAARLALDHVLTRAGLALHSAEPLFVVSRAGSDGCGPYSFAHLVDYLAAPTPAG